MPSSFHRSSPPTDPRAGPGTHGVLGGLLGLFSSGVLKQVYGWQGLWDIPE